ncbi:DUF2711 family protein [Sphingomonas sp.]|uniref:DUF2711 family protein n=1 Tax=Sphingomonas sp. TaxID=28214 RepID=UPI003B3A1102
MQDTDRSSLGPPDDTPILPWFDGIYARAFVALHPFFTIEGVDPAACEYGSVILSRSAAPSDVDLIEWMDDETRKRQIGKELAADAVDGLAKRLAQPIGWRAVARHIDLADHCALDRALRTSIDGLKDHLADRAAADRLAAHCRKNRIFLPTEGSFQPVMQPSLVRIFRQAGFQSVIMGDEFGDDDRLVDIGTLETDEPWDGMPDLPRHGVRRMLAPDHSLFAWVHWDSFYTLILGTADALRDLNVGQQFEGFWCAKETTTYWLSQACLPLEQAR